jgi:hypothetical protein
MYVCVRRERSYICVLDVSGRVVVLDGSGHITSNTHIHDLLRLAHTYMTVHV